MSNSRVSLEYFKKYGYPVSIPHNIDLDILLQQFPLSDVANAKDYVLYILSIVKNNKNYSYIHSNFIQKFVRHYSSIMKWLTERGILECDGIYKKGFKPYGYRYTSLYLTELKEEMILKRTLIQKIYKAKEQSRINSLTKLTVKFGNYGYEPIWIKYKTLASILGLMPKVMLRGLKILGALKNASEEINSNLDLYKYEHVIANGRSKPSLYFNEDAVEYVRKLSLEHPEFFPKAQKKTIKSADI